MDEYSKSKPAVCDKRERRKRLTLNKQIAAAPTLAKKWEIALHGRTPPTAIQRLPDEAFGLAGPSLHGPKWQARATEQLKRKFTDLLFPALLMDDTRPFEELIEAMIRRRKSSVSIDEFIRNQQQYRKLKPSKKEVGRRLRLALLSLNPDDLLNIRATKAALEKVERAFQEWHGFDFCLAPDDSKIYAVMKELNLRFLQPGDAARWSHNGTVVRSLSIQSNGKPKVSGMSLRELKALPCYLCQTNFRHGMTHPKA